MDRFCLDKCLLGTDKHLVVLDGMVMWSDDVPSETWHLNGVCKDNSDWCLDTVIRLSGRPIDMSPPKRYVQAMSIMSGSLEGVQVPWHRVMPAREHQGFTKRLIEEVGVAMARSPIEYYKTAWVPGNGVFKALQQASVDRQSWQALVDAQVGNVAVVRTFEPNDDGFAAPIGYNRFRTLTGRLTVEHGPQILTLKREYRNIIKSSFGENGSVWAIDFAALEVRILLYEYGRSCDNPDLYAMIAKELNHDRKAIKGAVICELYGSSKQALGKALGIEGKELTEFVKKVKAYFNTAELLERVKKEFIGTGHVVNRYGRHVLVDEPLDHVFINYYAQSTGADVALLGFKQVIDELAKKAPRARPIYLLHDAMLLDVHNDDLATLQEIKHVRVNGYVQKFPLRLEKIS